MDCGSCDPCVDAEGDCCDSSGNGSPGCDEFNCCSIVCGIDPFCCEVDWDAFCAFEACWSCQVCGCAGPHLIATGADSSVDGYLEITPGEYGSWATEFFGGGAFGGPGDLFNPSGPLAAKETAFTAGIMLFVGQDQRQLLAEYSAWSGILPGDTNLGKQITAATAGSDTNGDEIHDTLVSGFRVSGGGTDLSFVLTQHVYTVVEGESSELRQDYAITNNGGSPIDFLMVVTWDGDFIWDPDEDFADDEVGTATNARGTTNSVFQQEEGDPATRVLVHSPQASVYYGAKTGVDPSECKSGGVPYGYGTDFQVWDSYGVPDGSDGCDPHECSDETPCDPDDVEACPDTGGQEDCDPTNSPDASDWRNNIAGVGYNTNGASGADPPGCTACDASCGVQIPVSLGGRGTTTITVFHTYGAPASTSVCGNGDLEGSEECDDGNTADGDCCSSTCTADPAGTACDDGEECTVEDQCIGEPDNECAGEYQVQVFADICLPYDPPNSPQPNLDDILCVLDDFADGPAADGCTCEGFRNTTDLHPCPEDGGGDGTIGIDDILKMLDAFAGNPPCADPCPG